MAVIVQLLNGTNQCRDAGFQAEKSALLNEGVRKNYTNELAVTTNQVATGMCFVEVTRDVVTPNETFLIPIWVTAPVTVSTSGDGWIIVRIDQDSVNDGSGNAADGSGIATVEKVASLPSTDSYLILATLASGAITDARIWAQISESVVDEPIYYDEDAVGTDSYAISISGVKKYIDGKDYAFKALTTNVGAATLNINALGAKSIRKNFNIALDDGDIAAGQIIICRYDADNDIMQMQSPLGTTPTTITKASQAEAEGGTENTKYLSALRTTQHFAKHVLSGGTGADGPLSVSSGITTIDLAGAAFLIKNYSSIDITGTGKVVFINPHANGTFVIFRSVGDVTLTSNQVPMIDASGLGAAGGSGVVSTANLAGNAGNSSNAYTHIKNTGGIGGFISGTPTSPGDRTVGEVGSIFKHIFARYPLAIPGSGGGSGGIIHSSGGVSITSGDGGRGGGAFVIECGGVWTFTTPGGISVAGKVGTAATPSTGSGSSTGGGGGGGGGGFFGGVYNSLGSNTGTVNVSGGSFIGNTHINGDTQNPSGGAGHSSVALATINGLPAGYTMTAADGLAIIGSYTDFF